MRDEWIDKWIDLWIDRWTTAMAMLASELSERVEILIFIFVSY